MVNGDFSFITDVSLRKKIVDSIEMISLLYLIEKEGKIPEAFSKESRRIIILYAASIIEALLLYLYKKGDFSLKKTDYKEVSAFPRNFQNDVSFTFVYAKQVKTRLRDQDLMLDVLVKVFEEKNIIDSRLAAQIVKLKDVRNTFHLSKSRQGRIPSYRRVIDSTDAIVKTIEAARTFIVMKV